MDELSKQNIENKPIEKVNKSNEEWKKILSPEVFTVARMKGTEKARQQ